MRRLVSTDAEEYRTLMLEAYQNYPDAFTSSAEERAALPISWWQARLTPNLDAPEIIIGAFKQSELMGVVGLAFNTRRKIRHKCHLFGMYVRPSAQKSGIGKKLVISALNEAKSRPEVMIMQLTVTQGNHAAQKLYEMCGFTQFGIEPYAISGEQGYVSTIYMWCNLQPHLLTNS